MKEASNLKEFIDLSLEGQDVKPISSIFIDNQAKALMLKDAGLNTGDFKQLNEYLYQVEPNHAVLIKNELDVQVAYAYREMNAETIYDSVYHGTLDGFEKLTHEDFYHIATVLKIPDCFTSIEPGQLGFTEGGIILAKQIGEYAYVCTEYIAPDPVNSLCNKKLVTRGFFKIKTNDACALLDNISQFEMVFNVQFVEEFADDQNKEAIVIENEGEGGIYLDIFLRNWDGSEPLTMSLSSYDPLGQQGSGERVRYNYYNPNATRVGRFAGDYAFDVTIPAGTTRRFRAYVPIATDNQFSKNTEIGFLIRHVKKQDGTTLYAFDVNDASTYTFTGILLQDNDVLPVANFGQFSASIGAGQSIQVPIQLSQFPSPPISSAVEAKLFGNSNNISFSGSPIVSFEEGENNPKFITIQNTGSELETFQIYLEAIRNVEIAESARIDAIATTDSVVISFVNTTKTTTSDQVILPIELQRAGEQGRIRVKLEVAGLTDLVAGDDYVYIDENGQETTEIPELFIPAGQNNYFKDFIRFLTYDVDEDIEVSFSIKEAEDLTEEKAVVFDENSVYTFRQIDFERSLHHTTTFAYDNNGDVRFYSVFDPSSANDINIFDDLTVSVDPSTEIVPVGGNTKVLQIPREFPATNNICFNFDPEDETRGQDKVLRLKLSVPDPSVLNVDPNRIWEVVIPASENANKFPEPQFMESEDSKDLDSATWSFDASPSSDEDGTITQYDWDFGDGTPVQSLGAPTVLHEYQTEGTFNVTLTVTDNEGATAALTKQIVVSFAQNQAPQASFTATEDSKTVDDATWNFDGLGSSDIDGSIAGYQWDYGDGSPIDATSGANAQHVYTSAGSYNVTLTVTDNNGETDSVTQTINVELAQPVTDLSITSISTNRNTYAIGEDVSTWFTINHQNDPMTSYTVDFGDGTTPQTFTANTPPDSNSPVTLSGGYSTTGTKTITVTVNSANNSPADTISKTVDVA